MTNVCFISSFILLSVLLRYYKMDRRLECDYRADKDENYVLFTNLYKIVKMNVLVSQKSPDLFSKLSA